MLLKNTKIKEKKTIKLLFLHQFLRLRSNILPFQEKNLKQKISLAHIYFYLKNP